MKITTTRDYQQEGIDFLRERNSGALHWLPGLGKTYASTEAATWPILVACPTYLQWQWSDFIQEQYGATTAVALGTPNQRMSSLFSNADAHIINIEMLRSYIMPPNTQTFIIDEAHHVKNRNSEQGKKALLWGKIFPRTIELTATPIKKEADDLFMQLKILDPSNQEFSSFERFCDHYLIRSWGQGYRPIIRGVSRPRALKELRRKYAHECDYNKAGVAVPPVIYHSILVPMPDMMAKRYKRLKEEYRDGDHRYLNAVEVLTQLRRMTACQEKLDAVRSVIDDNRADTFIVYCHFRSTAAWIAKELNAVHIDGSVPSVQRIHRIKGAKRVVATIDSVSEGGDFTHIRNMIFVEEDYTPGTMTQVVGRIKRPNPNVAPVNAYYVMMKNTIDETIHACVARRVTDAQEIMEMEMM